MRIEILGVHPVEAEQPCHLVELRVQELDPPFDFGSITQVAPGLPPDSWQVPWDERFLDADGSALLNPAAPDDVPSLPELRVAFFFHELDRDRPLRTPAGDLPLPPETPRPRRLAFLLYEPP